MIQVGVLGATGYAGVELVRLLWEHGGVELCALGSGSFAGKPLSGVYEHFRGVPLPLLEDITDLSALPPIVFTSLPHGASKAVIPSLIAAGKKVIDLSGDFRYDDPAVYEQWYKQEHSAPELLRESVYGLPELYREQIKTARLIGNPGCYTTCSILALAPLLKAGAVDPASVIIDAKSGATGAGRGLSLPTHFCELDETVRAYGIATHRHTSEIEQELSKLAGAPVPLSFTPHLLPIKRGILATCYATLKTPCAKQDLLALYHARYAGEPFVHIDDDGVPEPKHVNGSNRVAIGLEVDPRLSRVIVVACLDNLIKGAAGQAIQNMNLLAGFEETQGLRALPYYL